MEDAQEAATGPQPAAADAGYEEYTRQAWQMAMRYLQMGLSIIPTRMSDKMPAIEWKEHQTRAATEEEVTAWFEEGVPDGNGGLSKAFGLAIITGAISKLVVCDCDTQDALTYAITEANLFSLLGVRTTRGQHIYFKHPGAAVQNKVGGLGRDWPAVQGLDLRGDGGYVVAPPSLKFDSDGKFLHQYSFTCPDEELEAFFGTMPTWPGIKVRISAPQQDGEWSFDNIQLSATRAYGASVWEEMGERVKKLGRKLRDGDGRNQWLVRYVGECVASGMDETQAREAALQYQDTFFEVALPPSESETVLHSVIATDKRNHPEKYEQQIAYDSKNAVRQDRANAIRLITPKNLAQLKALSAGRSFLIDPFIPPNAIVQVVGFNGHGKSLWLMNLLWAAARAQHYGSAHIDQPVRSLYMDFEGSATTLEQRAGECTEMHGEMSENLAIWSANASGMDMPLTTGEGIEEFGRFIDETNPQIVVIDTVRQAWSGMEENSPHAWVKVNNIAMAIRNSGRSVVIVHHRNKPNQNGHGREAGSTAQLKDLDVQIFVTKVAEDVDQAKRDASIPDEITQVEDFSGNVRTAWSYLRLMLPQDFSLKYVFELSFGKLRQATENHIPTYIGHAQNTKTGAWTVVSSKTPRQKASLLLANGMAFDVVSDLLKVPQPTLKRWIQPQETTT